MNTAQVLIDAFQPKEKPQPYDSQATVVRVDGETLWVHFPGGVEETPVQRTINASEGDTVQVRVADGSAWVVGNASAPPTDDRVAIVARETAAVADEKAVTADGKAEEALELLRVQKAEIVNLNALWAEIDEAVINVMHSHGINADWINAGQVKFEYLEGTLIKSADYATTTEPKIYPDTDTYPETDVFPSRGERVTSGFAIDIENGAIYGGLYSDAMADLESRVYALEHALTYPKAPPASLTMASPVFPTNTPTNEEER